MVSVAVWGYGGNCGGGWALAFAGELRGLGFGERYAGAAVAAHE